MKVKILNSQFEILNCLVISILLALCLLAGCQEGQTTQQQPAVSDPNASQVILIETDTFPAYMSGVWQNKDFGWILKIEENGRLSKVRHTIGRANLTAGQVSTFPLVNNGQGVIEPGPWYIQYIATANELTVEIALKNFKYDLGGDVIEGSSRDIFMGPLPNQGETFWYADWISYPEFIATTEDKTYIDHELPFEAGDEVKGEIIFEKFDPDAAEEEAHQH